MMKRRLRATLFMAFAVPLGISASVPALHRRDSVMCGLVLTPRKTSKTTVMPPVGWHSKDRVHTAVGAGGDVNYTDKSGTCIGTCEKCGRAAPLDSSLLDDLVGRAQVDGILQVVTVVPPQLDLADLAGTAGDPFVPPPGVDP